MSDEFKIVKLLDKMQIVNIPSGLVPKGAYDEATDYAVGDSVDYLGSSYVMFVDAAAGTLPTDATKWQVIAIGHEKATGAEIDTGTDDLKYTTAKAITDSKLSFIDGTETLTNKTLTSPKINEDVALTSSATELNVLDGIPATLTATELGYVDGVTSAIQTQLGTKAPTTAPTFATSITGSYLTASEILGTGASKEIVSLPVATYPSLTELSYVKGLSSAIQTQLGNKAATDQTMYIGTTQVAINRASAALTLAGLTLTTPDIGTPSAGVLTNATGLPAASVLAGSLGTGAYVMDTSLTVPLINGSSAANGDITINGTSDATKTTSYVILQATGGNVGIGTTSPLKKLHVIGDVLIPVTKYLYSSHEVAPGIYRALIGAADIADTRVVVPGSGGTVSFREDAYGETLMTLKSNSGSSGGKVGIGTTSPGAKLQVVGTTFLNGGLDVGDTPYYDSTVAFSVKSNRTWIFNMYDGSVNPLLGLKQTGQFTIGALDGGSKLSVKGGISIGSGIYTSVSPSNGAIIEGNVGIGTTSPTNILSLGGNSARTFWLERHTTANTAGNTLTVTAGGATSGATDKAGGDLILTPGLSTGTGESGVQIKGVPAGSTGTTDGTQTLMIQVLGNKLGFFAQTPVVRQTELTDELTTITFTAPGTPDYAIQDLTDTGGFGFATKDEGNSVLAVVANLQARVNELETKLTAYGLLIDAD